MGKGRKHTEETKARISTSLTGRKRSAETKAKIAASRRGQKHSAETKRRISATQHERYLQALLYRAEENLGSARTGA